MKRRRTRKARRRKPAGKPGAPQSGTRFHDHVRIARRIAKKLGKKVARLTGKSSRRQRKK